MGPQGDEEPKDEPVTEHRAIMAYINSPEWEKRLEEARIKRQAIIAARAASEAEQREQGARAPEREPKPDHVAFRSQPPTRSRAQGAPEADSTVKAAPETEALRRLPHAWMPSILGLLAGFTLFGVLTAGSLLWLENGDVSAEFKQEQDREMRLPQERLGSLSRRDGLFSDVTQTAIRKGPEGARAGSQSRDFANLASAMRELSADYRVTIVTTANRQSALAQLRLDAAAAPAVDVRTTTFQMPRPTVAYFHDVDQAAAGRFSARIAGEPMDLRGLLPAPPAGTLEILLTGN